MKPAPTGVYRDWTPTDDHRFASLPIISSFYRRTPKFLRDNFF